MKQLIQSWRAIAHTYYGEQHLLYMGTSQEQVQKNYPNSFSSVLTFTEQMGVNRVTLEKWKGKPNYGNWWILDNLKVPRIQKEIIEKS